MADYQFALDFMVRDYECDMQGIVNNAVYQHYLEHTRHQFLHTLGIDFAQVTLSGLRLVVRRITIQYKKPLSSGDNFLVGLNVRRLSPIRVLFLQDIKLTANNQLMVQAQVEATGIDQSGKFRLPKALLI